MFRFAPETTLVNRKAKLVEAFIMGFRFDTKVLLVLLIPILAISLFAWINKSWMQSVYRKFVFWYSFIILSIVSFLLLVDQQYYLYFQSHFNVLIFALIQDDTKAIIVSMWEDHPFLRILIIALLYGFLLYKILKVLLKYELRDVNIKWPFQILGVVLFGFLLFSGIRGTYSTFPLEKDDLTISDDVFVNYLASNAIFSIQTAVEDKNKTFANTDNNQMLQEYGYQSIEEVLKDYYGDEFHSAKNFMDDVFSKTPIDSLLNAKPPHVVFAMMESMSNYYLDFHHKDSFNLLGSLEPHFKSDYLFRNFVSGENGTIVTLENIMINMPEHSIAQSPYKYTSFLTSVAKPYKDAGYSTIFITSGKQTWRNLDEFVPRNYFDTVYSKSTVLSTISGSTECEWGVYDEYMFDFVNILLQKATKPTLVFVLTTTNHTPFERPANYKPYPLVWNKEIDSKIHFNHDRAKQNFLNYQYANDALGQFMNKIKSSSLKDKTIVAASGDHNNWMLFQYDDTQLHMQYGVPLYMYVPEYYQRNTIKDEQRFGSHKDIFTTLIPLSLSNANYLNIGNNLLSMDTTQCFFGVNEKNVVISKYGVIKNVMNTTPEYFTWNNSQLSRMNDTSNNNELKKIATKARAREILLKYCFNQIVSQK
ncbi:MAG: sulfatase-like hydrolase/transferase [Cytophagaceae bacterium]